MVMVVGVAGARGLVVVVFGVHNMHSAFQPGHPVVLRLQAA